MSTKEQPGAEMRGKAVADNPHTMGTDDLWQVSHDPHHYEASFVAACRTEFELRLREDERAGGDLRQRVAARNPLP